MLSSVPRSESRLPHTTRYGEPAEPACLTLTAPQYEQAVRVLRPALLEQALQQCQGDDAQDCVAEAVSLGLFNLAQFLCPGRMQGPRGARLWTPDTAWRGDLACWLRRILSNVIAGFFRKQTRRGECVFAEDAPQGQQAEHDRAEYETERALALHDELYHRLGHVTLTALQDACIRRYLGGQTQQAIAGDLDIGRRMVGYHIEAAAGRLRQPGDPDISAYLFLLFAECSFHAKYTKPTDIWPDWMQQHPPDINLSAWIRRQERRQAQANASDTQTRGGE